MLTSDFQLPQVVRERSIVYQTCKLRVLGVVNGPLKNEKSRQILSKSQNLAQPTNGSRSLRFVSVGHIFAFLSSHYTFSSRAWILMYNASLGISASLGFTIHHPYYKPCWMLVGNYTMQLTAGFLDLSIGNAGVSVLVSH